VGGFVLALFSDIATQARLALSVSGPLAYNNGTGAFTITLADSTHNGYLSAVDWNTFNNKQTSVAPGADTQAIFNNAGVFDSDSGFAYDVGSQVLSALNLNVGTIGTPLTKFLTDGSGQIGSVSITASGDIFTGGNISNDPHILSEDGSINLSGGKFRLDTTGLVVACSGDTTVGNGLASIVGYANQSASANITTTNLFTPPVDGMYEASVVQLVTSHGTSGTLDTTLGWTDEVGAVTATVPGSLSLGANGRSQGSVVFSATAGHAISFSTALGAQVGAVTYRVKIAVKRLS
jgi:hypothetical protein